MKKYGIKVSQLGSDRFVMEGSLNGGMRVTEFTEEEADQWLKDWYIDWFVEHGRAEKVELGTTMKD